MHRQPPRQLIGKKAVTTFHDEVCGDPRWHSLLAHKPVSEIPVARGDLTRSCAPALLDGPRCDNPAQVPALARWCECRCIGIVPSCQSSAMQIHISRCVRTDKGWVRPSEPLAAQPPQCLLAARYRSGWIDIVKTQPNTPWWRAFRKLASAATNEPACKGPVGEGAKRPR